MAPTYTRKVEVGKTGTGAGARTTQPKKKKAVVKKAGGGGAKGVASTGRVVVSASTSKGTTNDNGGRHVILDVLGAKRSGGAGAARAGAGGGLSPGKIQKTSNSNRVANAAPRVSRPAKVSDNNDRVGWGYGSSSSSLGSGSKTNRGGSNGSSSTSGKCATAVATAKVIVGAGNHPKKNDIKQLLNAYEKGWVADATFQAELTKLLV